MSSQLTRLLTITLFTFALVTFSVPAQATFPSPNGKIASSMGLTSTPSIPMALS